jgi:hypothetical protein
VYRTIHVLEPRLTAVDYYPIGAKPCRLREFRKKPVGRTRSPVPRYTP